MDNHLQEGSLFGLEIACFGLDHVMAPQAKDVLNARGRYGH